MILLFLITSHKLNYSIFTTLTYKLIIMNKIYFLSSLLFSLLLTSCQFTESITFEKNGSGKMNFSVDASEMMSMMGESMADSSEEAIDTIVNFKEFLEENKDSIAQLSPEEQETLKSLEDFTMHMVMNSQEGEVFFDLSTEFENTDKLSDMFAEMNKMQALSNNDSMNQGPFGGISENSGNIETSYSFDGKTFNRITKIIDQAAFDKNKDSIMQASMMFATSIYSLKYTFPKKIKSVSSENALISNEGKTVTVNYTLGDYISDPEKMNLEIVLEKK